MIGILQSHEIDKLIPLARAFIAESTEDIPFNENHFKATWTQLLASKVGTVLKYEKDNEIVGVLGFMIYPDMLSGLTVATEAFWFVRKENRGAGLRLLEEFEYTAKNMGAKQIRMAHLKNLMPEKLRSIYLKRGYIEIETTYEKKEV